MAASNGVTSLELYLKLSQRRAATVYASDYYDRIWLVRPRKSRWVTIFDIDQRPLQTVGFNFVVSAQRPEPARYVLNRLLQRYLRHRVIPVAAQLLRESISGASGGDTDDPVIQTVPLFHPKCLAYANVDSHFRLIHHNIFNPDQLRYDVVRAMNIITTDHLSYSLMSQALRACFHSLEDGGILVLGRSVDEIDGRLRATAYERIEKKLRPIWSSHGGYECPELIEDHNRSREEAASEVA
jgi:hypothetical protein